LPRLESMKARRVAVVGGGPAGLMAAQRLAEQGYAVTVYDRMPSLGRKLLMAGRGGLNLTHSEPLDRFVSRYSSGQAMLASIIRAFPPEALRTWADVLGGKTFIGSSGRVFPAAMKASPLLRAWIARLDQLGVGFVLHARWLGWTSDGALSFSTPSGPMTDQPDATVLALGGASWPRLGSDGTWTQALVNRAVKLTPFAPSNCGILIDWSAPFASRFAGTALQTIGLSSDGKSSRGEAMVTSNGLEGGGIYALSSPIRAALAGSGRAGLLLDLKPDMSVEALTARLKAAPSAESMANRLRKRARLLPVAAGLLRESGSVPTEAAALANRIKALPLTITGMSGLDRAISSAGGIQWQAMDDKLMMTALPGTFVAGEMLDWDAPTGGYLLQACMATGVAAAQGVDRWLKRPKAPAD
jgi:uncharacterized flavoprotein (TIGR03862 family)